MRVTAREAAGPVVISPGQPGSRAAARNETLHLGVAQPTRLDVWRRDAASRGAADDRRLHADGTRELGAARGMATAVVAGMALWAVIIMAVRSFLA